MNYLIRSVTDDPVETNTISIKPVKYPAGTDTQGLRPGGGFVAAIKVGGETRSTPSPFILAAVAQKGRNIQVFLV